MMVICASGTAERVHGFLRSVLLNLHPGVYVSVDLDAGSRTRIWEILKGWWEADGRGTVVMLWRNREKPFEIDFDVLGAARREIVEYDGHWALRSNAEDGHKSISENER